MTEVTILGFPPSSYVRTALMACAIKGVKHTLQPVNFRADDYRSDHPFNKIPALHHGDVTLYETLAITTYIDEAFDGPALQPDSPIERARMLQWISATNDYMVDAMVRRCIRERFIKPMRGQDPDEDVIAKALPDITYQLDLLNTTLAETRYLAGDQLTLADLFAAPIIAYLEGTPEGDAALPSRPHITQWLNRMKETAQFDQINQVGS